MTAGKYINLNIHRSNQHFAQGYVYVAGLPPKILQDPEKMLSTFKTQNKAIKFLQNYSGTKPTLPNAFNPSGGPTKITIFHI